MVLLGARSTNADSPCVANSGIDPTRCPAGAHPVLLEALGARLRSWGRRIPLSPRPFGSILSRTRSREQWQCCVVSGGATLSRAAPFASIGGDGRPADSVANCPGV